MKTISELTDEWNEFANDIKDGYAYTIFEFDHDIGIRNIIQKSIESKIISEEILDEINRIDKEVKKNVIVYKQQYGYWWWDFCFPMRASKRLIANVEVLLGKEWALKIIDIT